MCRRNELVVSICKPLLIIIDKKQMSSIDAKVCGGEFD